MVKYPPVNAGDAGYTGLIPESRRSSGEGNGSPLQYSCLETSVDRGALQATVHGVTESDTTERLHPTLITMYTAMQLTKTRASETLGIFALQSFYSKFMQEKKCLVSKCRSWLPRKLILIEMDKKIV